MTRTLYAFFLLLTSFGVNALSYTDGPYIFYKNKQVLVQYVGDSTIAGSKDSFPEAKKTTRDIQVKFATNPSLNFSFRIHPSIDTTPCIISTKATKLFVISDIEGEFEAFRSLLLAAGVIDAKYNWKFGTGHLVIVGDLFDRGKQVVQELWLLYKLEQGARRKGGSVDIVLGNHDIMNLSGDLRYVDQSYFTNATQLQKNYRELYDTTAELGRWLRSKPIMLKIDSLLFLHGGISPAVLATRKDIAAINRECRPYFATTRKLIPDSLQIFFGTDAPFWYRGYFMEPLAAAEHVDETLRFFHCNHIIVGHTITDTTIVTKYERKVIGVDVDQHKGQHKALLIDKGRYTIIDDRGLVQQVVLKL